MSILHICGGEEFEKWAGPPPYWPPSRRQLEALEMIEETIERSRGDWGHPRTGFPGLVVYWLLRRRWVDVHEGVDGKHELFLTEIGREVLQIERDDDARWSPKLRRWIPVQP